MVSILESTIVVLSIAAASLASEVSDAFQSSQLVPDLIPVAPSALASVQYESQSKGFSPGTILSLDDLGSQPQVTWEATAGSFYTLAMIDSDAPSRENPELSPFKHWLVVNIPGDDVAGGEVLAEYVPPSPPPTSGLHRYAFLVYAQQSHIDYNENKLTSNTSRINFPFLDFTNKYQLGDPVAGNFFEAENDIMNI